MKLNSDFGYGLWSHPYQEDHRSVNEEHGEGFVIPTKSFVKIGITTIFCYNNKMDSSINKTFVCCSKVFGCSNKKCICCP